MSEAQGEKGKWYRVWRGERKGYFEGQLDEIDEDGWAWLIGDDGEEYTCHVRDLEEA
jgi:hypothetical protein